MKLDQNNDLPSAVIGSDLRDLTVTEAALDRSVPVLQTRTST